MNRPQQQFARQVTTYCSSRKLLARLDRINQIEADSFTFLRKRIFFVRLGHLVTKEFYHVQ